MNCTCLFTLRTFCYSYQNLIKRHLYPICSNIFRIACTVCICNFVRFFEFLFELTWARSEKQCFQKHKKIVHHKSGRFSLVLTWLCIDWSIKVKRRIWSGFINKYFFLNLASLARSRLLKLNDQLINDHVHKIYNFCIKNFIPLFLLHE